MERISHENRGWSHSVRLKISLFMGCSKPLAAGGSQEDSTVGFGLPLRQCSLSTAANCCGLQKAALRHLPAACLQLQDSEQRPSRLLPLLRSLRLGGSHYASASWRSEDQSTPGRPECVGLTGLLGRDHVNSCQLVLPRRERHQRADLERKWM